jgi:hypothetical protein
MTERPPIKIDAAFNEEARAMVRAMNTGELPPKSAPYYDRVKKLAEMHWAEKARRATRNGGRS